MIKLDRQQRAEIFDLLSTTNGMDSPEGRRSIINSAFFSHPLVNRLHYDFTTEAFVNETITVLINIGLIKQDDGNESEALWILLEYIKENDHVGSDKKLIIENIIENAIVFYNNLDRHVDVLQNSSIQVNTHTHIITCNDEIKKLIMAPNGDFVAATGRSTGLTNVWDTKTGELMLKEIEGYAWTFSEYGDLMLLWNGGNELTSFNLLKKEYISSFHVRDIINWLYDKEPILKFAKFVGDTSNVISMSSDSTIILWDALTGGVIRRWTKAYLGRRTNAGNRSVRIDHVESLDFCPKNNIVTLENTRGYNEVFIKIININFENIERRLDLNDGPFDQVQFSSDGKFLLLGRNSYWRIYDIENEHFVGKQFDTESISNVDDLMLIQLSSSKYIYICVLPAKYHSSNEIAVYDSRTGYELVRYKTQDKIYACSKRFDYIALKETPNAIRIYETGLK